jgi:hypothetical protein
MAEAKTSALHQVHTAIQDVLAGYAALKERGKDAILPVARDFEAMHRRHAAEIEALVAERGEECGGESIRSTVNKVAVTLLDWTGSLDAGARPVVGTGEELLLEVYDAALEGWVTKADDEGQEAIARQARDIRAKVAELR